MKKIIILKNNWIYKININKKSRKNLLLYQININYQSNTKKWNMIDI